MTPNIERVQAALAYIPAGDRDTWLRIGMAVKSELGDDGFPIWDEWSRCAENYQERDAKATWRSIKPSGKVTAGTLMYEAQQRGWKPTGTGQRPDPAETERQRKERAQREAKDAAELEQRQSRARDQAQEIWRRCQPLAAHDYVTAKGIKQYGAKLYRGPLVISDKRVDGSLVTPLVDTAGVIHALQYITPSGAKLFPFGSAKSGHYFAIGKPAQRIIVCEGYATACSIHEATGEAVAIAFDKGNLAPVAAAIWGKYPDLELVIAADNDAWTDGNPGVSAATIAAKAVNARLAIPTFTDSSSKPTDFNDLHKLEGLDSVRAQIEGADSPEPQTEKTAVTDVTGVQASNGTASDVTADATADVTGVTSEVEPAIPDADKRPIFKVFDDWQLLPDGSKLRPGVWYFSLKAGKGDAPPTLFQQWLCSTLHIEAVTFDGQDNNFGRLLRFKNTLGRWREWAMPMELLRGAGDDLRGELLAMGVLIDPHAKNLLGQYLQAITPKRRVNCALQVGWCGDSFVLPDTVIGPAASGVIFQSGERGHDEHTRGGTLAGWQSDIAARAVGNPLLTLALSASFAGPMLARCNGESGGIHFVGDSSTGKTTAIEAACATWGGANFRRSWRATANGMEGAAALFNDCLLALDEISECDPREVGAIVYALGNGRGKQRASRTGNARGVTRWRVVVLSSGERTIGTTMAEGGYRAKAGQSVRLLDIPAARRFGAWDELHGLPNGAAFADAIRRAAVAHHGHAGRAFLEKLTRDRRDFCELLERFKALPIFSADGGEGQDKRTAGRFALLALAGEVATEYWITGWPEGEAIKAAVVGFKAWRSMRGRRNDEPRQILEQVSGFVERHGDSRFSNANANESDDVMRINRAGWWREEDGGRVYLFNAEGLREALKGFDFKRALDTLQEAGALPKADASGERAKAQRIAGRLVKLYAIRADKLELDHGA
jgi:putative DNA primase/helicase